MYACIEPVHRCRCPDNVAAGQFSRRDISGHLEGHLERVARESNRHRIRAEAREAHAQGQLPRD